MSQLKCLKIICKNVRSLIFVPKKSFCSKKVEGLNVKIKLDESKNEKKNSGEVLLEQEDEAVLITERGKDASLKSRLTKEYNKFMSGKSLHVLTIKDSYKLNVDVGDTKSVSNTGDKTLDETLKKFSEKISTSKPSIKVDKTLDKTISKLKEGIVAPPPPPSGPPPPKKITLQRQEAGEVILTFIPKEWYTFFIPKTGVTGFGTFLFTTGIFLISKEYYVLEHNYYNGLSMAIIVGMGIHYLGRDLANYLDKEIKEYLNYLNKAKQHSKDNLNKSIDLELFEQFQIEGNLMLVNAKRENVHLQLEDEFRKRQVTVYNEVKRLLDYQVAIEQVQRKIKQKNLVDYVTKQVLCSFTPEMQDKLIKVSIDNLIKELSKLENESPGKGDGAATNCP